MFLALYAAYLAVAPAAEHMLAAVGAATDLDVRRVDHPAQQGVVHAAHAVHVAH